MNLSASLNTTSPDALVSGFTLKRKVPKQISPDRGTVIWYASICFSAVLSALVVYYVIVAFLADESPVRLILTMSHFSMLLHLLSVTVPLPVHVLMFAQFTISHVYKWQYLADLSQQIKAVFPISE